MKNKKERKRILRSRIIEKFLRLKTEDVWAGNTPDG